MQNFSVRSFSQQVLLASLLIMSTAQAAGYTVRDLGHDTAYDLNKQGQVLGKGILWNSDGSAQTLTGLSASLKVNDQGTVLGVVSSDSGAPGYPGKQIVVRLADGTVVPVDGLSATADESKALVAINARNNVLVKGSSGLSFWNPGTRQLVPVQTASTLDNFEPTGLGENGPIIGSATQPSTTAPGHKVVHVVAIPTASIPAYLTPSTYLSFKPLAINGQNQVVGKKDTLNAKQAVTATRAYLWSRDTGEKALPSLFLYSFTEPSDINDKGQVVGTARFAASSATTTAFIWSQSTGIVNLNSQIGFAALTTKVLSAKAINESGQILAHGLVNGQHKALLLTPKP